LDISNYDFCFLSLKYQKFTPLRSIEIENKNFEFVANTQFLSNDTTCNDGSGILETFI